jgi:hypothetical protein
MYSPDKLKPLLVALCVTSSCVHSAELIQFSAGQPARAAEVNANFKALNDELAELKSFEALTEEQVNKLKDVVGVAGGSLYVETAVDCTDNPAALQNLHAQIGENKVSATIKITGSCYGNLQKQYSNFTLRIEGAEEGRASKLVADPNGDFSLLGGFNGGLYLENLTVQPGAGNIAVLFSRSGQGQINNVTVEGGAIGLQVQANAQAYMSNTTIRNTTSSAIRILSGGDLRILGNNDNAVYVDTASGTGFYVEQGTAIINNGVITAPIALNIILNGSVATYYNAALTMNGTVQLRDASHFSANRADVNGDIQLNNSAFASRVSNIKGAVRGDQGAHLLVASGSLAALTPNSGDYDAKLALQLTAGSSAFLGTWSDTNQVNLAGHVSVSQSSLTAQRATFDATWHLESGNVVVRNSNLSSSAQNETHPVNLRGGSALTIADSNVQLNNILAVNGDTIQCERSTLNTTGFSLNSKSSFRAENCTASGHFNAEGGGVYSLHGSDMSGATFDVNSSSNLGAWQSRIALLHLKSTSSGTLYDSEIVGGKGMPWDSSNFYMLVDSSSAISLDQSTVAGVSHLQLDGTIRLQNSVTMTGVNLNCHPKSFVYWWMPEDSKNTTIAGLGAYNCQE